MKKRDLKKLALLGLASGMLVATQTCLHAADSTNALSVQSEGLPEADLLSQLSPEAQLLYMGLDQEGQALARLITSDEIGQVNTYRSGGHGCGGGKCGGGGGGSYQGGGSSGHSCGGGGGGGVVYQGGSGGHSCGGGGSYQGGSSGHSCGGSGVIYQGGGSPYGGHSCGNSSSHCSGSSHCANGMAPGQPMMQPVNQPMNMPKGQPGQPQTLQNGNRSMPQFENQPKYQQDVPVDPKVVPGSKPTAYLDQPVKPGRYVAQVAVTQESLEAQLNKEGKETFKALSPEGKKLAVTLASQDCKGKNTCKGLNSCKTDDNSCAGQGGCKGTSKGPFTDKNQAVKVAAMKEKRQTALRGY